MIPRSATTPVSTLLYYTGLFAIAAALPFSNFVMTIAQFILLAAWLAGGDYMIRLNRFLGNKTAMVFCAFYVLHLFGMLYTADFRSGLTDLRVKLPLLALPFIVSGMPVIAERYFKNILWVFIASVLLRTVTVLINPEWEPVSHIRFSMMVSFSVFILLYLGFSQMNIWLKVATCALAAWLVFFLVRFPYDTGIVTFVCALSVFTAIKIIQAKQLWIKAAFFFTIVALAASIFFFLRAGVRDFFGNPVRAAAGEVTLHGEQYAVPGKEDLENGNYLWQHIAWTELRSTWDKRSTKPFGGNDATGQPLYATLIRFLTSKSYRKDAEGVEKLTQEEIHAIENGIANVRYMDGMSLNDRLYETLWSLHQYHIGNNPQGHSVTQRFEFWRTAWSAFLLSPYFGNGTGSVRSTLAEQYEKMDSVLDPSHRLKTHNQYLATAIALGLAGVGVLLLAFLFPVFYERRWGDALFMAFLVIVLAAMLVEDTLETQPGVTFVAFFSALLLFTSGSKAVQIHE